MVIEGRGERGNRNTAELEKPLKGRRLIIVKAYIGLKHTQRCY